MSHMQMLMYGAIESKLFCNGLLGTSSSNNWKGISYNPGSYDYERFPTLEDT
jgi:hypothetical protein